ncbi:putative quinol monooxygenase [Propionivibrio dicarboxylicus]|uniref:Quinol monooxygenase YgiN n=1 Tax=Propionivibrio dicarboxylicus TaxID=83767 RepID=A0A1G7WHM3_9RHOO|nr:putative quinol monooxygenase [Propionivibrio dicarboxylicus]SDG71473.1 Quinol monooxygenase YgiN [Propionivibrio dicarboxylicus]
MVHVLASLYIKEGCLAEFIEIFKANVPNVLKEDGCIEYVPAIDLVTDIPTQDKNACIVTVIEKWDSLEALQAHSVAPHMLAYGEQVKGMLEKVSLKILQNA